MVKLILTCVLSITTVSAIQTSGLFSAVNVAQYPGHVYTEWPKPPFVFFAGEPVNLSVAIGNRGPDGDTIRFTTAQAGHMFRVAAFRDGQPFDLALTFDDGEWRSSSGEVAPLRATEPIQLNRQEQVRWVVRVGELQQPGIYRVAIEPSAVDSASKRIPAHGAWVEFEVRPASAAAQPELARREAVRQYLAHAPFGTPEVDNALERLLRIYPSSYEGHLLRGHLARARNNEADAVKNYTAAANILANDEDTLLVKFRSPRDRQQMLNNVNALIKRQ